MLFSIGRSSVAGRAVVAPERPDTVRSFCESLVRVNLVVQLDDIKRTGPKNGRSRIAGTLHWGKKVCVLLVSHNGSAAEGEKAVNAVRAALPKPIIDFAGPMPYPALQSLFDGLYPKGLQWYWKGDFVKTLPDAAIDTHPVRRVRPISFQSTAMLSLAGGDAMTAKP